MTTDDLREIADLLDEEREKVLGLLVAVRGAKAACNTPAEAWVTIPRTQWLAVCAALEFIDAENQS
jgi:hypothetical protein